MRNVTGSLITLMFLVPGLAAAEDVTLKAMRDELRRTEVKLRMDELARPYYAAYQVFDATTAVITATFGSLTGFDISPSRNIVADVRIGGREFDNSNYVGQDFYAYKPFTASAPEETDYDALRFSLWSLTDAAYKSALQKYSQKKAYREKKDIREIYGDLSVEKPETLLEPEPAFSIFDMAVWKERVRKLSAVFRDFPDVQTSNVSLDYAARTSRFVNSEGASYRLFRDKVSLYLSATVQTAEGLKISDSKGFYWPSLAAVPAFEELSAQTRKFAGDMSYLVKSSTMEAYLGPVMFEDEAASEFFNQLLVHNVSFPRKPWADDEDSLKYYVGSGDFIDKLSMRVMPTFMNVYDDPLQTGYNGVPLNGSYAIDSEGVKPGKLELVKNGKLTGFYMSRAPVKQFRVSNGHGRGHYSEFPAGRPGNVFILSDKTAPKAELKKKLIELAKEQGLDYGILVKRLGPEIDLGYEDLLADPVLAYKVYVSDGREEPVHGAEFTGVSYRALRDIVLTSDENYIYNYYQPGPVIYARGYIPAAIVAPSILVFEMELKNTDTKPDRKPYLPHPYFSK